MVNLTSFLRWNGYHNIPRKFIRRRMFQGVVYENNHGITPTVVYDYTKNWVYDENAPWTTMAKLKNDPKNPPKPIFVPPLKEWHFYRGDKVQIMTGKDAGKVGTVVGVIKQRNWVIVQGLNCKLEVKNMPAVREEVRLNYIQKEMPLVVHRDVKLIDPSDNKPCEAVWRVTADGEKVRVSKRTGHVLPLAPEAFATADYTKRSAYKAGTKDTDTQELSQITFEPKYKTFEKDLMDEYGIVETKQKAETYEY